MRVIASWRLKAGVCGGPLDLGVLHVEDLGDQDLGLGLGLELEVHVARGATIAGGESSIGAGKTGMEMQRQGVHEIDPSPGLWSELMVIRQGGGVLHGHERHPRIRAQVLNVLVAVTLQVPQKTPALGRTQSLQTRQGPRIQSRVPNSTRWASFAAILLPIM